MHVCVEDAFVTPFTTSHTECNDYSYRLQSRMIIFNGHVIDDVLGIHHRDICWLATWQLLFVQGSFATCCNYRSLTFM